MTDWKPEGWHSVTPRLVVTDLAREVRFLKQAFGAVGTLRRARPTELFVGDTVVMVSGAGVREAMPAILCLYVEDVDATYRAAVRAGAAVAEEPVEVPYGDRRCIVLDPCGNTWQIATRVA